MSYLGMKTGNVPSNSVLSHENSPLLDVVREVYHDMNFSADLDKRIKEKANELFKETN